MTIDSAKDLQMNIAKEGLALLMFHPSFNVQPHRECIFLIGTAWDIPVGDTQEVISLIVFTVVVTLLFKGETFHWNHIAAFFCLVAAVYLVFLK